MKIIGAIRAWWESLLPPLTDPPPTAISSLFAPPLRVWADEYGATITDRDGKPFIHVMPRDQRVSTADAERQAEAIVRLIDDAWQREIAIEAADARVW